MTTRRNVNVIVFFVLLLLCMALVSPLRADSGIYFDDLLVTNGGNTVLSDNFDSGNLSAWNCGGSSGAVLSSTHSHSGLYSLHVTSPGFHSASVQHSLSISNPQTVEASAWIYATTPGNDYYWHHNCSDFTSLYLYSGSSSDILSAGADLEPGETGYRIWINYNHYPNETWAGSSSTSSIVLQPNTWGLLDLKLEPSTSTVTAYLNGVKQAQVTYDPTYWTSINEVSVWGWLGDDGRVLCAGLDSNGGIWYTPDLATWNHVPGVLSSLVVGDFDGDGEYDLAGLYSDGSIWYTADMQNWVNIPGQLKTLVVGDFNNDGKDDLAGLASDGSIWYTTDMQTWINVPGYLSNLISGGFSYSGSKFGLAGISSDGSIWYTTDMISWQNIPGKLSSLAAVTLNDRFTEELSGVASDGSLWGTSDMTNWTNVPGKLVSLVSRDLSYWGQQGMAGLASDHTIWYTTDMINWANVPGSLNTIVSTDLNDDRVSDLVGLAADNSIWYTTNMTSWNNIPGKLASICAPRR